MISGLILAETSVFQTDTQSSPTGILAFTLQVQNQGFTFSVCVGLVTEVNMYTLQGSKSFLIASSDSFRV